MVRIRMQRLGRRNRPFYRISAVEKRTRRDGPVIENLGWFDPLGGEGKQISLNAERIKFWISKGAQPSETVQDFLAKNGIIDTKQWEADRAEARKRVEAKVAAEAAAKAAEPEKKK